MPGSRFYGTSNDAEILQQFSRYRGVSSEESVQKWLRNCKYRQTPGCLFLTQFRLAFHWLQSSGRDLIDTSYRPWGNHVFHHESELFLCQICRLYIKSANSSISKWKYLRCESDLLEFEKYQYSHLMVHCNDFRVFCFSISAAAEDERKEFLRCLLSFSGGNSAKFCSVNPNRYISKFDFASTQEEFLTSESWNEWLNEKWPGTFVAWKIQAKSFPLVRVAKTCFISQLNLNQAAAANLPQFSFMWSGKCFFHMTSTNHKNMKNRCISDVLEDTVFVRARNALFGLELSGPEPPPPSLPELDEIQGSFDIVFDFLTVREKRTFAIAKSFTSAIDQSGWLILVSRVLDTVQRMLLAIRKDSKKQSVVIIEESPNMRCVLLSLMQLLVFPEFRSIRGFQKLVQKEWICSGHDFSARLGLNSRDFLRDRSMGQVMREQSIGLLNVFNPGFNSAPNISTECPLFLLFLDCVFQITSQFPSLFEFSQIYLSTIWSSVLTGAFSNFHLNSSNWVKNLSLWNWSQQYSPLQLWTFRNPLYQPTNQPDELLDFSSEPPALQIWDSVFLRYVPSMKIPEVTQLYPRGPDSGASYADGQTCGLMSVVLTPFEVECNQILAMHHRFGMPEFLDVLNSSFEQYHRQNSQDDNCLEKKIKSLIRTESFRQPTMTSLSSSEYLEDESEDVSYSSEFEELEDAAAAAFEETGASETHSKESAGATSNGPAYDFSLNRITELARRGSANTLNSAKKIFSTNL